MKSTLYDVIICDKNNQLICSHKRTYDAYQKYVTDPEHTSVLERNRIPQFKILSEVGKKDRTAHAPVYPGRALQLRV